MFAHRSDRARGRRAASLAAVMLAAGCDDPELNTDLRPAGPPEVLAVLVLTDAAAQLSEQATYCQPGDPLRPSLVGLPNFTTQQVCPDDVSLDVEAPVDNAYPDGWYVRIMFDELLDPDIEDLTEVVDETGAGTGTFAGSIRAANPVLLECRSVIDNEFRVVDYDGYYSPSGNRVTWPLGPSLVIKPNDPTLIGTGKECQITLHDSIVDKERRPVPEAQRGPYPFSIAPIMVIATDPADSHDDESPTQVDAAHLFVSNFYFQFNTDVTVASLCADTDSPGTFAADFGDADAGAHLCDEGTEKFQLMPPVLPSEAGGGWGVCNVTGAPCQTVADCAPADDHCDSSYAYTFNGLAADDEIGIGYTTPLKTETAYAFSLPAGTILTDRCGGQTTLEEATPDNLQQIRFLTNAFDLAGINVTTGDVAPMARKPTLSFTNAVDATTLLASEYSLSPLPQGFVAGQITGTDIVLGGHYAPGTTYTLTLNAGATVSDPYGATYTTTEATTISWTTQPAVMMTGFSPSNNGTVQKSRAQERLDVTLTFNADIDIATLTTADFTFVNTTTGVSVTTLPSFLISPGVSGNTCDAVSAGCQLRIRADLAPGAYKFTLLQGAQLADALGNVYTQPQDLVINFTVLPAPQAPRCL